MKRALPIGIDTVEFTVAGTGMHLSNTTTATVTNDDGELEGSFQNRVFFPGKFGKHKLAVRTENMGTVLRVEGALYGFGYGQNAFLPGDLQFACAKALKAVIHRTALRPSDSRQKWHLDEIELHRVDLVLNFQLDSRAVVLDTIKALKRHFIEYPVRVYCYDGCVHWNPEGGREYSIRIYAKGQELARSRRKRNEQLDAPLVDECDNVLRLELQLRRGGLEVNQLTRAVDWNDAKTEQVFRKYMKRLPLPKIAVGEVSEAALEQIPPNLRHVFALYMQGVDLSRIYAIRTLQRYRKEFRELGIDLKMPYKASKPLKSIREELAPSRALRDPPAWIRSAGLYPKA